jgi:hypothetical protein
VNGSNTIKRVEYKSSNKIETGSAYFFNRNIFHTTVPYLKEKKSPIVGGSIAVHCTDWLIDHIVSKGEAHIFNEHSRLEKATNARITTFFLVYKYNGDYFSFFTFPGPAYSNWEHSQAHVVYCLRLVGKERFLNEHEDPRLPIAQSTVASITDSGCNLSEMESLERYFDRCVLCSNTQRGCIAKPMHQMWCLACFAGQGGIYMLKKIISIHLIELYRRRGVRWYQISGSAARVSLISSKYATILAFSEREKKIDKFFVSLKIDNIPNVEQPYLTHYPAVPSHEDFKAELKISEQVSKFSRFSRRDTINYLGQTEELRNCLHVWLYDEGDESDVVQGLPNDAIASVFSDMESNIIARFIQSHCV